MTRRFLNRKKLVGELMAGAAILTCLAIGADYAGAFGFGGGGGFRGGGG